MYIVSVDKARLQKKINTSTKLIDWNSFSVQFSWNTKNNPVFSP